MNPAAEPTVIRDPLWNNIRIDPQALAIIDSEAFQRLRYVRQLGHAFLVYPGATHTRFEHAIGAYHLARRTSTRSSTCGGTRTCVAFPTGPSTWTGCWTPWR